MYHHEIYTGTRRECEMLKAFLAANKFDIGALQRIESMVIGSKLEEYVLIVSGPSLQSSDKDYIRSYSQGVVDATAAMQS